MENRCSWIFRIGSSKYSRMASVTKHCPLTQLCTTWLPVNSLVKYLVHPVGLLPYHDWRRMCIPTQSLALKIALYVAIYNWCIYTGHIEYASILILMCSKLGMKICMHSLPHTMHHQFNQYAGSTSFNVHQIILQMYNMIVQVIYRYVLLHMTLHTHMYNFILLHNYDIVLYVCTYLSSWSSHLCIRSNTCLV